MKREYLLLAGAITILTTLLHGCTTVDKSEINSITHSTYTNWASGYIVDYPAGWLLTELEKRVLLTAPGEFSVHAELNMLESDANVDNWLTAEPNWCDDYQVIGHSSSRTSFTGYYGKVPIYGEVHVIKVNDRHCILTLINSMNLPTYHEYKLPDEFEIILTSLRPIEEFTTSVPTPLHFQSSPVTTDINQLYSEYLLDETSANTRYKTHKLLFSGIRVEAINSFLKNPDPIIGQGEAFVFKRHPENVDVYVMSGSVKFKPRYSWMIFSIREGCKLEIEGKVLGLESGVLIIEDCLFYITEGPQGSVY
jgi:hypothetical protein